MTKVFDTDRHTRLGIRGLERGETVEIYEKGSGDVDRSARYSVAEVVRDVGVETADFKLFRRLVKVVNPSNETQIIQIAVCAATDFKPKNWVIPGVIYGDNAFGNQVSPSGLERDGEPWVFGYDRESIPACTLSETSDSLFALFASDRDAASLESACSLRRLEDGLLNTGSSIPSAKARCAMRSSTAMSAATTNGLRCLLARPSRRHPSS